MSHRVAPRPQAPPDEIGRLDAGRLEGTGTALRQCHGEINATPRPEIQIEARWGLAEARHNAFDEHHGFARTGKNGAVAGRKHLVKGIGPEAGFSCAGLGFGGEQEVAAGMGGSIGPIAGEARIEDRLGNADLATAAGASSSHSSAADSYVMGSSRR